jgi:succinate dehydrogenase / fumarate reductase, iron-sulfur subunit
MPDQTIDLRIWRSVGGGGHRPHFDRFTLPVDSGRDTILDLIERTWSSLDRTLVYRHACHHASCGTCAIRVDGRERLPCITNVADVWNGRSALTLEPLRNFPVVADLAVDPSGLLARMFALQMPYVRTVEPAVRACSGVAHDGDVGAAERFEDCLECGACVSACPVAGGDPDYLGPAVLAAAERLIETTDGIRAARALDMADTDHGVWECRSIWACSAVCPSGADPAAGIMALRRAVLTQSTRTASTGRSSKYPEGRAAS